MNSTDSTKPDNRASVAELHRLRGMNERLLWDLARARGVSPAQLATHYANHAPTGTAVAPTQARLTV